MTSRRAAVRVALVVVLAALVAGRWAAVAGADRLWADALGVRATHGAVADLKLVLLTLAFVLAAAWCLGNLFLVYRTIGSVHVPRRLGNLEIVEAVPRRYLLYITVGLGLVIAAILSHGAGAWWQSFALLGGRVSTELRDPVLNRDLAYYLFRLPWERTLHAYLTELATVMLVITAMLYGLVGAIRVVNRRLEVADAARTHLGGLLVVFGLALAAGFRIDPAEYVAGLRGVPYDALLADVRLPVSRMLGGVALAATLASLVWIWVDRISVVVVSWGALAGFAVVGTFVAPGFAAALRSPDRLEAPELVAAQRRMLSVAFGMPAADTTIDPPATPDPQVFTRRRAEVLLAPVWHPAVLNDLLNRIATEHPYQRFAGLALDAYPGRDGRPLPIYVGAREIDLLSVREADPAVSWASVHAGPYTHAAGALAIPASAVSPSGLPLFVPDLARPDSQGAQLTEVGLDVRDVFFGPSTEEYAVVPPSGRQIGIRPRGLARRFTLAWTLQSPRLLSTRAVAADDIVLWHRGVVDRLDRYAPFARFGSPYAVVVERRLVWLAWGYVSGEAFPMSVVARWRDQEVHYLRASFVGVVDAYSGETAVYLLDEPDPLGAAWAALAPDVVQPASRLPADLRSHIRYPEELFAVQRALVTGAPPLGAPIVRRPVPGEPGTLGPFRAPTPSPPVALVGTLPGDETLRLRLRAVDERGDAGLLESVIDGSVEGTQPRLRVLRLAQPLAHPGPSQAAKDSPGEAGSSGLATGPVTPLVFPQGIVMLRSVFTRPVGEGTVPRLKEVVARSGSALGRGPTLDAAFRDLAAASQLSAGTASEWSEAREWFRRLDEARRAGDWAAFGRAYEQLRRLLVKPRDSVP